MPDDLSLSRSELPEEIVKAIDALTRAHEEAAADAGWGAVPRTQEIDAAYEALTAAILCRLGEAEAQGAPFGTGYSRAEPSGLGASPEYPSRTQWQPIASAPRDGTLVDLWTYWPEHDRWRREAGCGWVDGDWHNGRWAFRQYEQPPTATHWMPLPAPPALSEAPPQGEQ